jgi:hypothetical protein
MNGIEKLIEDLPASTSLLYIDVQGRKRAGQNSISILTILPAGSNTIYIIDVKILGGFTFETKKSGGGRTIGSILESPDVTKVFFSMSNPHELWAAHSIRLQGAEEMHIMENAYRAMTNPNPPNLTLMECVEKDLTNCPDVIVQTFCQQVDTFSKLSDDGLFDRPLHTGRIPTPDITKYCSSVVFALRELRNMYWQSLPTYLKTKVDQTSQERVELMTLDTTVYSPSDVDNLPNSW